MAALFTIFVFPGVLFLGTFGLLGEFVDRKLYARMQNRKGPPWYQPLADFIKLASKREVVPEEADPFMFRLMPILALSSVMCAYLFIPLWNNSALFSFEGDLIVILYLLTIPTMAFFLGGWYSTSLFATIGAVRALTQLFAYEVPLFMAILAPALLTGSWRLQNVTVFYSDHPLLICLNVIAFCVSLIALQGKLEKVPFDIPEAETEIVGGTFTEYSGRLLGLFRLAIDAEAIVCASLVAAIFLPFGITFGGTIGFFLYLFKVFVVLFLLSLFRTVLVRLRVDQMVTFCWKWVAPFALAQLFISLLMRGVL